MMNFGVQLSMKSVPVKCQTITELANMLEALPFKHGLSNNTIHFQLVIAGPTVKQGDVQTSVSADLNINVYSAQKRMPLSLAANGFQIMASLPTPVKVNQLAHFLEGYDSNLKKQFGSGVYIRFQN